MSSYEIRSKEGVLLSKSNDKVNHNPHYLLITKLLGMMGKQYGGGPQFVEIPPMEDNGQGYIKSLRALPQGLSSHEPIHICDKIFFPLVQIHYEAQLGESQALSILRSHAKGQESLGSSRSKVVPDLNSLSSPYLPQRYIHILTSRVHERSGETLPIGFIEFTESSLRKESLSQISDTIALFLSLRKSRESILDSLQAVEENIIKHNDNISIVHLRRGSSTLGEVRKEAMKDINFVGPRPPPSHLLIEGDDHLEAYKKAFKHHCQKKNYAFLFYSDLNNQSRLLVESLQSLGNTTLYIPNLANLSSKEAQALLELIEKRNEKSPTLVGGAPHNSQTMLPIQDRLKEQLLSSQDSPHRPAHI